MLARDCEDSDRDGRADQAGNDGRRHGRRQMNAPQTHIIEIPGHLFALTRALIVAFIGRAPDMQPNAGCVVWFRDAAKSHVTAQATIQLYRTLFGGCVFADLAADEPELAAIIRACIARNQEAHK